MDTIISPFSCQTRNQHPPAPPHRRRYSPPPATPNLQDVRKGANLNMPLADLTFRRIATTHHQFRFNHQRANPLSLNNNNLVSISNQSMADEPKKIVDEPKKIDDKPENALVSPIVESNKQVKERSTPPPPPEKPLPGDCCGSGCVRCVWDVYYDELEEYNRLCKE